MLVAHYPKSVFDNTSLMGMRTAQEHVHTAPPTSLIHRQKIA